MRQRKLIVVAGPTAVGKTPVAIELARVFQTSVVSADSRQIYKEMTIGTAKPGPFEQGEIQHYFIDSHSVADQYDAAAYARDALKLINELFMRNQEVILCGGSGLYIKGVCEGFDEMPDVPQEVRESLMQRYREQGIEWLQHQMRELDPVTLDSIDANNPHRLIRALEVRLASGKSILSFRKNTPQERDFKIIKLGLELPREELYARIDARMDRMIADGLFEEAEALYPMQHCNALQTVGYQEIFGYMEKRYGYEECVRLLKRNSRRYAKRQLTWFKKDLQFRWFHPDQIDDMVQFIKAENSSEVWD
jgi:tRNA dimethylallyltransferase